MKLKFLTSFMVLWLLASMGKAQYVTIPNADFKSYLQSKIPTCFNASGQLDTTCTGVLSLDTIFIYGVGFSGPQSTISINDFSGVEYFKNLKVLDIRGHSFSSLPALPNSIQHLDIGWNANNTYLSTLPTSLITFYAYQAGLTALPTLPNSMRVMDVLGNNLSTLPKLPDSLRYLRTYGNSSLTCLPILPNFLATLCTNVPCIPNKPDSLLNLGGNCTIPPVCNATNNPNGCSYILPNYITLPDSNFASYLYRRIPSCMAYDPVSKIYSLDTTCTGVLTLDSIQIDNATFTNGQKITSIKGVEYCKALKKLVVTSQSISTIQTLPPQLQWLELSINQLTTLPALPVSLTYLACYLNNLISLPTLPAGLQKLIIPYNPIASLNGLLPTSLKLLGIWSTNIKCLPQLPDSLQYLSVDSFQIACLPNRPNGLAVYANSSPYTLNIPVCNPSNNINGCSYTLSNYVSIPDSNFGKYLYTQIPTCMFYDTAAALYKMDTTCNGVLNMLTLNANSQNIKNLDGVQYFKRLRQLNCIDNLLSVLPALPDTLWELDCNKNQLTSLPALPSGLIRLSCNFNKLTVLPSLPNSLLLINCTNNQLISLPTLPTNLGNLRCDNNQLINLPNLPHTLTGLNCSFNQLNNLPLLPNSLTSLNCNNNKLTSLPVLPNLLFILYCSQNKLVSLPTLPVSLQILDCSSNQLTSLPALSPFTKTLICDSNQLTSLPSLSAIHTPIDTAISISCIGNNIYCLPKLPAGPLSMNSRIYIDTSKIKCISNLPNLVNSLNQVVGTMRVVSSALDTGIINYPVCNPTNNVNGCQTYPLFKGIVYNDNNSNMILDNNEFKRANIKVSLQTGESTHTDDKGEYKIWADSTGSNTISLTSPNLYNSVPISITHNFANYTDSTTDTFALIPTLIKDSVLVAISNYWGFTRPGGNMYYNVLFENVGTTVLNTNLVIQYNNAKVVFDSFITRFWYGSVGGMAPSTYTNTGNSLIIPLTIKPGERGYFVPVFTTKTTTPMGDSIITYATLSGGTVVATDSSILYVRASYDPNDKIATPQLTPAQVNAGNYIDYTIRFENTGNDTAFNVVITDTLSNLLQNYNLQRVSSSHNVRTTLWPNGAATFEFLNINLPDSNVNKTACHGFIRFRLLPKANLAAGTIIPNKASIYFDYNSPIVTNTCSTIIKNVALPVNLISYDVQLNKTSSKQDIPQIENKWATAEEVNTAYFVVMRSFNGVSFESVGKVFAKGAGSYNYTDVFTQAFEGKVYYRLQIVDKDGSISFSQVKQVTVSSPVVQVNLYPNPASTVVYIVGEKIKQVTITNMLGKVVKQVAITSTLQPIAVEGLANGIYQVQVIGTDGSVQNQKLIISK